MTWADFQSESHPQVTAYEAWFASLLPPVRAHEEGEIEELFEAAALGQLSATGDEKTPIKPVVTEPEVFELRRTSLSKRLRFYHGEPAEHQILLRLHRHIKVDGRSQEEAMRFAGERFDDWYARTTE